MDDFKGLSNYEFRTPLALATYLYIDWSFWAIRNVPFFESALLWLPKSLVNLVTTRPWSASIITQVGAHEILESELDRPKSMTKMIEITKRQAPENRPECMMTRWIEEQQRLKDTTRALTDNCLIAEAEVTMWAGVMDMGNALPLATFWLCHTPELQSPNKIVPGAEDCLA